MRLGGKFGFIVFLRAGKGVDSWVEKFGFLVLPVRGKIWSLRGKKSGFMVLQRGGKSLDLFFVLPFEGWKSSALRSGKAFNPSTAGQRIPP